MTISRKLTTLGLSTIALATLAGCALGAAAPTSSPTPVASTPSASPTPSATSATPDGSALVVGSCRPTADAAIPAIYSVTGDNARALTVTVDAFDSDGSSAKTTVTAAGPAVTIVSWDDCRSGGTSTLWTLQAAYADGSAGNLHCSLASYNGEVGQPAQRDGESGSTEPVVCSGTLNGR